MARKFTQQVSYVWEWVISFIYNRVHNLGQIVNCRMCAKDQNQERESQETQTYVITAHSPSKQTSSLRQIYPRDSH